LVVHTIPFKEESDRVRDLKLKIERLFEMFVLNHTFWFSKLLITY
jgi:hypothetical protein